MGSDYCQIAAKLCNGSVCVLAWGIFLPFCDGQSSEQSSEQSEDNSVHLLRKGIDDHDPVVNESMRESRSTWKDVEEGLPCDKSKKSQGKHQKGLRSGHGYRKWWGYF